MKARIVTDNEKRPRRGGSLSDRLKNVMGSCVIEAFDRVCGEPGPERTAGQLPGFLRTRGWRRDRPIRYQSVGGHISADLGGILTSALGQLASTVFHAGFRAFGLGVAK